MQVNEAVKVRGVKQSRIGCHWLDGPTARAMHGRLSPRLPADVESELFYVKMEAEEEMAQPIPDWMRLENEKEIAAGEHH